MGNMEGPDRCSPGSGVVPQLRNTELEEPTICSKHRARLLIYIEGDRTPSFKVAHCEFNPEKLSEYREARVLHSGHSQDWDRPSEHCFFQ